MIPLAPLARVVVLRDLGLGALLAAVPALRALARALPGARRGLVVHPRYRAVVELITAGRDGTPPYRCLLSPAGLGTAPDLAVDLQGAGRRSHQAVLETEPGCFVGFADPSCPESAGGPAWRETEHETVRWCRLVRSIGLAVDADDLDLETPGTWRAHDRQGRGPTVLHLGAAPERRWPAAHFAAVARAEACAGRTVLLSGTEADRRVAVAIAAASGLDERSVVAGATDLATLVALVGAAERVVCADTGVAQLATALRVPSVIIFGERSPSEWGPPPGRWWHRCLVRSPDASGRTPAGPDTVIGALADLPERRAVPERRARSSA